MYHRQQMSKSILWDRVLTRSGLELKRNVKIFVPIAPLGGSSNAVKARVDNTTFKREKKEIKIQAACRMTTSKNLLVLYYYFIRNNLSIKNKKNKNKSNTTMQETRSPP